MARKKIVPEPWHIPVDPFWDNRVSTERKNKFNRNKKHNTPFQHVLQKHNCCLRGREVAGSKTFQQHWNTGGVQAREHLWDYAASGVERAGMWGYPSEREYASLKKMPAFVREYFTLAVEQAKHEMKALQGEAKLEALKKKYSNKPRPKI